MARYRTGDKVVAYNHLLQDWREGLIVSYDDKHETYVVKFVGELQQLYRLLPDEISGEYDERN